MVLPSYCLLADTLGVWMGEDCWKIWCQGVEEGRLKTMKIKVKRSLLCLILISAICHINIDKSSAGDVYSQRIYESVYSDIIFFNPVYVNKDSIFKKGSSDFSMQGINCQFETAFDKDGLSVIVQFDEIKKMDQFVRFFIPPRNAAEGKGIVNLKKEHYLALTYMLDDADVQTIQIILWGKKKKDKIAEPAIINISETAFAEGSFTTYIVDLNKIPSFQTIDDNFVEYTLGKIEFRLGKKKEFDSSRKLRGKYRFRIRHLGFLKKSELPFIIKNVRENMYKGFIDRYFYLDKTSGNHKYLKKISKIPYWVNNYYKNRIRNYIDIKDIRHLNLVVTDPGNMRDGTYRIRFYLDTDGDDIFNNWVEENLEIHKIFGVASINTLNVYEKLRLLCSNNKSCRLIYIGLFYDSEEIWRYRMSTLILQEFHR